MGDDAFAEILNIMNERRPLQQEIFLFWKIERIFDFFSFQF